MVWIFWNWLMFRVSRAPSQHTASFFVRNWLLLSTTFMRLCPSPLVCCSFKILFHFFVDLTTCLRFRKPITIQTFYPHTLEDSKNNITVESLRLWTVRYLRCLLYADFRFTYHRIVASMSKNERCYDFDYPFSLLQLIKFDEHPPSFRLVFVHIKRRQLPPAHNDLCRSFLV